MKVIFFLTGFTLVLLIGSCGDASKKSTNLKVEKNTVKSSEPTIQEAVIVDEFAFFSEEGFTCQLIQESSYHSDEVAKNSMDSTWIGLFKNKEGYYLAATHLKTKRVFDQIVDEENKKTGWEVSNDNSDECIIMIGGVVLKNQYKIETAKIKNNQILPDKPLKFTLNDKHFQLYATADSIAPAKEGELYGIIEKYKIYLKGEKEGVKYNQLIATHPYLTDTPVEILFIGDIDQDGYPDLILNNSNHYNVDEITLFLTRSAGKTKYLKKVGKHRSVGC